MLASAVAAHSWTAHATCLRAGSATLILRDMHQHQLRHADLQPCDMAAFVFDANSLESFRTAQQLLYRVTAVADDTLPCVLVAAVADPDTTSVNPEAGTVYVACSCTALHILYACVPCQLLITQNG